MSKTVFERNFEVATKRQLEIANRPMSALEMAKLFFDDAIFLPTRLENYVPVKGRKNAIVLLGQSCVGKSTYAKEFIKTHPEFQFVSMDECADRELRKTRRIFCFDMNIMANTLGFKEFGQLLEQGENLIIDGNWLHLNSRGALIKTLRSLGYKICAFSFLPFPAQKHAERIRARAMQYTAREVLHPIGIFSLDDKDWIDEYRAKFKLTRDEAIMKLKVHPVFAQYCATETERINAEFVESDTAMQYECGLTYLAFDYIVFVA